MSLAKPRFGALEALSRSQIEVILYEANLGLEDTKLARRYFIDRVPQIDVAMEMDIDRKTVGARLRKIERRIAQELDRISP